MVVSKMAYVARRLYSGLLFDPNRFAFHPLFAVITIILQFALFVSQKKEFLTIILLILIIENALFHNLKALWSTFLAFIPIVMITLILSFFLSGLNLTYLFTVKLLIALCIACIFFNHVNPSELGRAFESLRIPSSLALIPTLSFTMIPRIVKDANETIETLKIRGEIKGIFFRWLPKVFAIFIASSIYRSRFLAQSLYFRGFGVGERTHYKKLTIHWIDIARILFWLGVVILAISDLKFNFIPTYITFSF